MKCQNCGRVADDADPRSYDGWLIAGPAPAPLCPECVELLYPEEHNES